MMCRGQLITAGMGDIIDINLLAIKTAMDIEGIQNQKNCLRKVQKLFQISQKLRKANKDEN